MNVVILGAGTVGSSIAELLCQHPDFHITVVDVDPQKTESLNERLDVRALVGSVSKATVLFQAGIATADICLAVTGIDEVNIIAASIAKQMGCRRSIARVYAPVFRDLSTFDYQEHFKIDRMLSLEHLTALELARGIRDASGVMVEQFARGGLAVHDVTIQENSKLLGRPLKELDLPRNVRIGTIRRGNRMWIATADDVLEPGDTLIVFSRPEDKKSILQLFNLSQGKSRRVVIAGGGETGFHLAKLLEFENVRITILESDPERCEELAAQLKHAAVIQTDAAVRDNLEEERVGTTDVFVACTGDDEDNIIFAVEAKDLGAQQVLAVIERQDYSIITRKLGIDRTVSQRDVMAKRIESFMTRGIVVSKARLPDGLVNLMEVEVTEDAPIAHKPLSEADLPNRCLIVAIMKPGFVRVASAEDKLEPGDNVVMLVEDDVEPAALALFQPAG